MSSKFIPVCFTIKATGTPETTSNDNTYLECETDIGVVAFWGSPTTMRNINTILALHLPAKVAAACIDSNWPEQHRYWCPESSGVIA